MNNYAIALLSVLVISLASLVGIFTLSLKQARLESILTYLISFSAGALFGDVFIHLLPEVVAEHGFTTNISIYVLLGIIVSFLLEKVIHWRHCHHVTCHDHPHPFAWMNLFGDGVHNFIDGLIIGAAFMVSLPVGFATATAVLFHEIPQEIGDFGVLVHGGFSKKKALTLNFATALTAVLGVVVAYAIGEYVENLAMFLVPFAAGTFIYIAGSDLIPELHKETKAFTSFKQLTVFIIGVAIMFALIYTESDSHGHSEGSHIKIEHHYEDEH